MPNALAYLALFAWPILAYSLFRRMPPHRAAIWTILGGYLLLPEKTEVDLPLLPALDKTFIPAAAALLFCLPAIRATGGLWLLRGIAAPLVLIYLFGPFVTVLTNGDAVRFGPRILPGQELYDAFSFGLEHAVLLLPFLIARRLLADETAHRDLLLALALAGLAYSLPALFEIRMSPQLHTWIYGFFPHSFTQQMRYEGFRPVVFLSHGLRLAMFLTLGLLAMAALWRMLRGGPDPRLARRVAFAFLWLLGTLILSKTVSSLAIVALTLPAMLYFTLRGQAAFAGAVALFVLLYPMLRGADIAPVDAALTAAEAIDADRAASLAYRLANEDILLERAAERPLFGWGGWGRNRVYDPESGEDVSTTDGRWVIVAGVYGWLGYLAEFGLLTLPLILRMRRRGLDPPSPVTLALGIILAANLIDQIPNASLSPITWMLAGALIGRLEVERAARRAGAAAMVWRGREGFGTDPRPPGQGPERADGRTGGRPGGFGGPDPARRTALLPDDAGALSLGRTRGPGRRAPRSPGGAFPRAGRPRA